MNIFYCDIIGTITDGSLNKLANSLNKIIEKDHLEQLTFSFVTTNNLKDLIEYLKLLIPYLNNDKILIGTQFCDKFQINNKGEISENNAITKADMIFNDIKDKSVNYMYYAEDQLLNTIIVTGFIKVKRPEINFTTFTPGTFLEGSKSFGSKQKGINGLEDSIDKYLVKKI